MDAKQAQIWAQLDAKKATERKVLHSAHLRSVIVNGLERVNAQINLRNPALIDMKVSSLCNVSVQP